MMQGGEWVAPVTVATKPRVVMGTRIIDIAFTWKLDMDMDVDVDEDEDVNVPTLAPRQGPATGVLREWILCTLATCACADVAASKAICA